MSSDITLDETGSLPLTPEMLTHLRVKPGQKVKVTLLEDGRILLAGAVEAPGAQLLRGILGRKLDT
ncbi:hypothetical protein [Niveispirillum irakense]|uniref:hypothetical protein n=1 Tax=Niveispirillum irakense TaxID=34011 RepID=UPI0003F52D57|nr:hypothetical protein [Niveispirillum irakense]